MIRSLWITTALLLGFVGVIAAFLDWRWMAWGGAIAAVFLVSGTLLARKRARSRKFARWGKFFLLRGGLLLQKTSIGFQDKIQSVSLRESPFDRRWKMASIAIDTSGAGVADHELKIELLDVEKARLEYEVLRQWNSLMTSQIIPPHPPCTHPKI
jgi:putative membrane protein